MTVPAGLLIAIEGVDGAGKSTFQRLLAARLRREGWSVGRWREPTDRRLGERAQKAGPSRPWTAAMFFTLDRLRARPRLESTLRRFDIVLSDRSFYSTLAYQGSALPRADREALPAIQRRVTVPPTLVFYLRLPTDVALHRVHRRGGKRAPLERRRTLDRVSRAYDRLATGRDWLVLDGRRPTEELVERAAARLRPRRPRRGRGQGRR